MRVLLGLLLASVCFLLAASEPPAKQSPQTAPPALSAQPVQPSASATPEQWVAFWRAKAAYQEKLADHYRQMYDNLYMQVTAPQETRANENADTFLNDLKAKAQKQSAPVKK